MPDESLAGEAISARSFTIGWVCALQEEYDAACRMLDDEIEDLEDDETDLNDDNAYVFGTIGGHHVVIGCLPEGRGAPTSQKDIRLGDVVVAVPYKTNGGVVQYDFGKRLPDGCFVRTGYLNATPDALLSVLPQIRRLYNDPTKPDRIAGHMKRMDPFPHYQRPPVDNLFRSDYPHTGNSCNGCLSRMTIQRPVRQTSRQLMVHFGTVASGNSVIKDAEIRDRYANDPELNVLCFEMEAAGLMNDFPCLVIRGICDYADTHKNDEWHNYAALAAASYAREVLLSLKPRKVDSMPYLSERMKKISHSLTEVQNATGITQTVVENLHREFLSSKLHTWLRAPDISVNFVRGQGLRYKDTGLWFLTGRKFQAWKSGQRQNLWLYGVPGCGKSVLCSTAIEHLNDKEGNGSSGIVLAFFFDFTDSSKSSLDQLLRSLLEQLYIRSPTSRPVLELLHRESVETMRHPTTKSLSSTLFAMSRKSTESIQIVIDALDECKTRTELLVWIQELIKAQETDNIQLLVSSRKEEDIERALSSCLTQDDGISIQGQAVDADIKTYVHGMIRSENGFRRWSARPDVLNEIETELMKKADGMFRWVACQLDVLEKCYHIRALRKALVSLPESLDETYARILRNIRHENRDDAIRLLQFMCFSEGPLTVKEAVDALAVNLADGAYFDTSERMPVPREITGIASSLISTTPDHKIQLAHFSVKEYLISERVESSFSAHLIEIEARASITRVCLVYMNHLEKSRTAEEIIALFPLAAYAAQNWMKHARYAEGRPETLKAIKYFLLEQIDAYTCWLKLFEPDEPWRGVPPEPHQRRERTQLYYAAKAGLPHVVRLLLDNGAAIDDEGGIYGTALQVACIRGHEDVVQALLERGANVNAKCGLHGDALTASCFRGHVSITKMLLEAGASFDPTHPLSPLSVARNEKHDAVVQLLLISAHQKTSETQASLSHTQSLNSARPLANEYMRFWSELFPAGPETTQKTYHTWQVNWSDPKGSPTFRVDADSQISWRVLLSISASEGVIALYLHHTSVKDGGHFWHGLVQFAFVVWNPNDPSKYVARNSMHYFRPGQTNWGFRKFSRATNLAKELANNSNPSTGWLNVLLQTYYHVPALRRMVYKIPTGYRATTDMAWALQRCFYALQVSKIPVSTDELTHALGWRTGEPQDAEQKAREFLELLEDRMGPTAAGCDLRSLFVGQTETSLVSLDSDLGRSRPESFWDLHLNITDHRSIRHYCSFFESLQSYNSSQGAEENLSGFKGELGSFGLTIQSLPTILEIHPRRYDYDIKSARFKKVDAFWEFPEEVDLSPFLSFSANRSESCVYRLFSVITHEGTLSDGVYYVYVRPTGDGPFFRFHDEQVTPAMLEEVLDSNFGGDCGDMNHSCKVAFMLFYFRVSRMREVFEEIREADIPLSLRFTRLAARV
ncbi:Ankyrin repeat protein [Penicillium macrosclerotiorum]|uniref:Ankyrin repeat protein n=1 Tax=Penicillium macrosclerotiorum TaxID=303699 RepID=UPI0025477E27|nr:Ankyrin repeat protein [Penicillium macrosclerotiorum]KAJ5688691.1 Ankyrin repeat protein [Penicillium macrosclerotiorum]